MPFCISDTTKIWCGGIISVASGAIGTAVSTMIVDPTTFNFQAGFSNVLIVAAVSGAISVLNYLKRSPLPGVTPPDVPSK